VGGASDRGAIHFELFPWLARPSNLTTIALTSRHTCFLLIFFLPYAFLPPLASRHLSLIVQIFPLKLEAFSFSFFPHHRIEAHLHLPQISDRRMGNKPGPKKQYSYGIPQTCTSHQQRSGSKFTFLLFFYYVIIPQSTQCSQASSPSVFHLGRDGRHV